MVPARNLLRRHYDTYGGFDADAGPHFNHHKLSLTPSNLISMAENQHQHQLQPEPEPEPQENLEGEQPTTSSSHHHHSHRRDESWLQLAIGPTASSSDPSTASTSSNSNITTIAAAAAAPRVELQLFERPHVQSSHAVSTGMPMFASTSTSTSAASSYSPPWGFWNYQNPNLNPNLVMPLQYYHQPYNVGRLPFQLPPPLPPPAEGGGSHLRVVGPPQRRQQQIGVWFLLRAAENQVREPFLPQIPKSYIRIKDGMMTVRLLMKYLVNKLGLSDESEVQISCRGQPLLPFQTLHHVRNSIWCLNQEVTFHPDSPSSDHVMTLQYSRSP